MYKVIDTTTKKTLKDGFKNKMDAKEYRNKMEIDKYPDKKLGEQCQYRYCVSRGHKHPLGEVSNSLVSKTSVVDFNKKRKKERRGNKISVKTDAFGIFVGG